MANGKITLGKQSGGTIGLVFPDGVSNTEVVLPESGELATKEYADLKVALASFVGTNQSLSENGYQKLPGGLIIQWGIASITFSGSGTRSVNITYPIAFPTRMLSVAIAQNTSDPSVYNAGCAFSGLTGFVFYQSSSISSSGTAYNRWIAIGY